MEKSDSNELGVMGYELSRKADSITFAQERLKKQVDNLDEKVKVRLSVGDQTFFANPTSNNVVLMAQLKYYSN